MRERQLIDAIHRRLPKSLHRQSMTMGALTQNGTPDYWYDGPDSDLWIEYKQVNRIPRDGIVVPALTQLQCRWLERRYRNGGNVRVVVGLPEHRVLRFDKLLDWEIGLHVYDMQDFSYDEIAQWICDFCGCSCDRAAR